MNIFEREYNKRKVQYMNPKTYLMYILLIIFFCSQNVSGEEYWGKYTGEVKTKWLKDGLKMEILRDFSFTGPDGRVWNAPKGSIIDGASIPKVAWSLIGGPYSGIYRDASVIHDIACQNKNRPAEEVHKTFYYALKKSNVDEYTAQIFYFAVIKKNPRWDKKDILKIKSEYSNLNRKCFDITSNNGNTCFDFTDLSNTSMVYLVPESESGEGDRTLLEIGHLENHNLETCHKMPESNDIFCQKKIVGSFVKRSTVEYYYLTGAPEKTITDEKFYKLAEKIKAAIDDGDPMTLEEIRNLE